MYLVVILLPAIMAHRQLSACNTRNQGSILGWEDPLEEEMAIHSSFLARETPWMEELQSIGLQELDTT